MPNAQPAPELSGLLAHWQLQPLAIVVAVALCVIYLGALRSLRAEPGGPGWPARHTAVFVAGLALFVWTTCGWPEAYRRSLFWVWTAQTLTLLLVVPVLILAGQPLQLVRLVRGPGGVVDRFLRSRAGRVLGNPLVGPAVVPLLSAALFFGPLPAWVVRSETLAWLLQLLLVGLGAVIVLPLVGPVIEATSLAVGLSLAIGSFELVLDAIPGIALRLRTSTATDYFSHRQLHSWSPSPLHDQQIAGAIVWCLAELIDLPFLLLVYRRWLQADARDAAEVDAVLDAERAARSALSSAGRAGVRAGVESAIGESTNTVDSSDGAQPVTDAPWWLTDPQMRRRGFSDHPPVRGE